MELAGRKEEIALLNEISDKQESSFLAVYGRRRVGKTYLIRQVFERQMVFECSGLNQESTPAQLENFWITLTDLQANSKLTTTPRTWLQAFAQLRAYINSLKGEGKKVIFLDEVPWFETQKSGFLAALDNFWNQYCTKRKDIILVICGSAASWIIEKVINNKGGLHNRLTHRILLLPLTLGETKSFFELRNIKLSLKDIVQIYMCIGGVPYYLKEIQGGKSIPQILDQLFYKKQAILKNEFQNLYAALFKNNTLHEKVVETLANKNKGMTRNEIVKATGKASGGGLTTVLEELIQCGFIQQIFPIHKVKTESLYRLIDEYTLFYFKFLKDSKVNSSWQQVTESPTFKIWSGYAFENICFKHTYQIKKAMGIQGVISNEYSYLLKGNADKQGIQIDLVIDRADNCINIIDAKFHNKEYEVTEAYSRQLLEKAAIFKEETNTKKNIFVTMLSVYGVKKNEHFLSAVTNQLYLEDLFD